MAGRIYVARQTAGVTHGGLQWLLVYGH